MRRSEGLRIFQGSHFSFQCSSRYAGRRDGGTVPPEVRQDRGRRLAELEGDLRTAYFRRLTGRTLRVLAEAADRRRPGHMVGTACRYAPTSWPRVPRAVAGDLVRVWASTATAEGIDGTLIQGRCPGPLIAPAISRASLVELAFQLRCVTPLA